MNFYSYVRTNRTATAKDIATAKVTDNRSVIVAATLAQDKYEFVDDNTELRKAFGDIKGVNITLETLPNGNLCNRAVILLANDKKTKPLRCYGKKDSPMESRALTADELKKVVFGYCTSGGETLTDAILDAKTGEIVNAKRVYLNIEAL